MPWGSSTVLGGGVAMLLVSAVLALVMTQLFCAGGVTPIGWPACGPSGTVISYENTAVDACAAWMLVSVQVAL